MILVSHAAFDHYGDSASDREAHGRAGRLRRRGAREADRRRASRPTRSRRRPGASSSRSPGSWSGRWSATTGRSATLSDGRQVVGNPMAFIVETEPGVRIYHYGDTCIFDMRLIGELYRPTVGLLGCTAAARALAPHSRAGDVPHRRDGSPTRRPAWRRCWASSWPWHATTWRRTRRSTGSSSSFPHHDTTGGRTRRRAARGRDARGRARQALDRREGGRLMRLVTYRDGGRTGRRRPAGRRRSSTPGYGDMHDLIRAGADGRAQAETAAANDVAVEERGVARSDPPWEDPLLGRQLREPRRREPERCHADRAVLLLEAPERRHRPRRADPDPACGRRSRTTRWSWRW